MDLYLFPEAASFNNGYGIAVENAYNKLQPKIDDLIVWYTILNKKDMLHLKDGDTIIKKNNFYSIESVKNILIGKDRTELPYKKLSFLKNYEFENIHCDDVIFYRSLRKIFPNKKITLRLHNCFSRIYDRKRMLKLDVDWKFATKLKNMYTLEREIFQDKNVYKVFISDEDRNYYCTTFGRYTDSETWAFIPNMEKAIANRKSLHYNHKIVWFGGIESHKKSSMDWFINNVFSKLKDEMPDLELHLWGRGTLDFNNEVSSIYGHGFYNGDDFPMENSLYINPDIIGGGVKLKLLTLIEAGIPFISSIFGYEGFSKDLIDDKYIIVCEEDKWIEKISSILK